MSSTYKVNGMTTIHVNVFDSTRFLSTASYSIEEGGSYRREWHIFVYHKLGRYSAGVLVELDAGLRDDQRESMMLVYIEPGQHPDELVPWSQSLGSVPTRCDGFS
jgi:hypothetical protein